MHRLLKVTAILALFSAFGIAGCTNNTGINAATGAVAGGLIANELSDDNDVATALGVDGGRSLY